MNRNEHTSHEYPVSRRSAPPYRLFDENYPATERLPRLFMAQLVDRVDHLGRARTQLVIEGRIVGDELGDNAYLEDGYRFHDVFHLAYAAVLGWSPLIRRLLRRKRKSNAVVDDVEDGGRAIMLEESISALVFDYAHKRCLLEGQQRVEPSLLDTIGSLTSHLEVRHRLPTDWEKAILDGFRAWHRVVHARGGLLRVDLRLRQIEFVRNITAKSST
jgi:hypothetical protein